MRFCANRTTRLWSAHSQVWLQAAEVYLALDRADEADSCTAEATQLFPLSPHVLYMVRCMLFVFLSREVLQLTALRSRNLSVTATTRQWQGHLCW